MLLGTLKKLRSWWLSDRYALCCDTMDDYFEIASDKIEVHLFRVDGQDRYRIDSVRQESDAAWLVVEGHEIPVLACVAARMAELLVAGYRFVEIRC